MGALSEAGYAALATRLGGTYTPEVASFFHAWQRREGGNAAFNPFNTERGYAGASNYNTAGVKNYPTEDAGITATVDTLLLRPYRAIVAGIRSGNPWASIDLMASGFRTWSGGGYASLTNPNPSEDDMALSDDDVNRIANAVAAKFAADTTSTLMQIPATLTPFLDGFAKRLLQFVNLGK